MAKRRKRRSQKSFDLRLAKDLRAKRIVFLRELSEMVSNAVGVRIRCSFAGGDVIVPPAPGGARKGKADRPTAHLAGTGRDIDKRFLPPDAKGGEPPNDDIGF